MFAANRIERVKGRMMFLIVSMITINGMRIVGVLLGIRWISILDVLNVHLWAIIPSHRGRASVRVMDMCLVAVKMKGSRPKALFIIITMNSLSIMISV